MTTKRYRPALIVGAGLGLSAALARLFSRECIPVALYGRVSLRQGLCPFGPVRNGQVRATWNVTEQGT